MRTLIASVCLSLVLAAPLVAEEPCPPELAGPGLSYAANTLDASAFVDAVLERGSVLGPENTLVAIDIDNTLLAMHDDLGSDQWYRWQKALLAKPGPDVGEVAPDFDGMLRVQSFLFAARPMRLTQPNLAQIVSTLQDLGFPVIAVSARSPDTVGATLRELSRNGLDLTRTAPLGLPEMAGAELPFQPSHPQTAGLTPEEVAAYGLGVPQPVLYRDGVYLVSGQHKGVMLQLLLRRLGKSYPAIVFLDDRDKNVCEMAAAYDELPEVLTAFRYDRERLSAQAFLQDPARQERAIQDWARLTGRLPPLCEAVPETCTLVAGPVPAPGSEPTPERTVVFPDRPLRITTWNLQHMMSEPVFAQWAAACEPHGWDNEAARAAGKPVTLTYCNAHNGLNWPCGDRQESLPLDTAAAFERKAAALRARAAALAADIYAFQEVSDPGAVARILPPDYALFFVPAPVAMNVAFAVRQELAGAVQVRPLMALSVCDLPDRADPADPASCLEGVYRTRPGLELTLSTPSGTVALLNVHLKSSCRSHPVSAPRLDTLKARTCERPDFDQATADAEYRASVQAGCARLRDQVPAIEAWVDSQAEAGHNFMVLGDFNRDFVRELTTGMPARLDGTDARDPILPTTEIGSVLKEVSDRSPPGTFLYLVRQRLDTQDRTCRTPAGETYQVQGCHERIDNFLIGSRWAESVSDDPKGLTATGSDYGDGGYCAENARPSDHCPITLEITLPKAAPPVVGGPPPSIPPPVVVPPPTDLPMPPDSLMGEALRAWLRAHWYEGHHRTLGYDAARRALYSSVSVAPDARVYGVYSGFSQPAEDTTFLDPINAEHTVPQSFFGRGDPMRSDLHHLFPTHKDVNSARGSDPFGEIPDAATARWFGLKANGQLAKLGAIPPGNLDVYSEDRPEVFEPREGHEGDLARAVFYFYTVYPGRAGPLERITQDGIATLYKWHRDDPPDDWERGRNDRIAAVQGNRNFYIDRPDLVCRAWGLACD